MTFIMTVYSDNGRTGRILQWTDGLLTVGCILYMGVCGYGQGGAEVDRIFIMTVITAFALRAGAVLFSRHGDGGFRTAELDRLTFGLERCLAPYLRWAECWRLEYVGGQWIVMLLWQDEHSPTGMMLCRQPLAHILELVDNGQTMDGSMFVGQPYPPEQCGEAAVVE